MNVLPARTERCDSLVSMPRRLDAHDEHHRHGAVAEAAAALRRGELVAFPTETVYGLGALADDEVAVARLFAAKGRPSDHPLIVHVARAAQLERWTAVVGDVALRLADAFWPGPLTMVFDARDSVPRSVTGGQPSVALRVPSHPVARALLEAVGEGLAAPSANRFGRVSPTTADHVLDEFALDDPALVTLVLDAGPCTVGLESTIVDVRGAEPSLLRPGGVPLADLERVLGRPLREPSTGGDRPRVPGALTRHYAPAIPIRTVPAEALAGRPDDVIVVHRAGVPASGARTIALPSDPLGYARELYAAMRAAERSGARELWIASVPDEPAWAAVRDRLRRATGSPDGPGETTRGRT